MYTVVVEGGFSALHRVPQPDGTLEPLHGHDWRVRAFFSREELDERGMVVDFHEASRALHAVVRSLHGSDLSQHPALGQSPPTAEAVARHLFDALRRQNMSCLARVEVVEAPGCAASYEPHADGTAI